MSHARETAVVAFGFPARWSDSRRFDAPDDALLTSAQGAFETVGWRWHPLPDGALRARIPVNWKSWGERLQVRVHDGVVRCESRCVFGVVDWGKNRENVAEFFDILEVALRTDRAVRV